MGPVIYDTLTARQYARLPATVPPLEYVDGRVVQRWEAEVIYDGLTLEQFLRLPEAKPALEYLEGKVVQKVSPKTTHSVLQTRLASRLGDYARPRMYGDSYTELRCTFGGQSLVFDVCVFARGRIPRDAKGRLVDDVFLPPDLAIEVLSRGQTVKNLSRRLERAIRDGVRLAWLIQPTQERVFVFRPSQTIEEIHQAGELSGEHVLPGFVLPLAELFGWLIA